MRFVLAGLAGALILCPGLLGAAVADEKADVATIKACLKGSAENPRSCIGPISTACQAKPEGQTTEGSVACTDREQAAWDVILNERYKAEMKAATETDADYKTYPDFEFEPVAESLKAAQRAWIAYRDGECRRRYNLYQNGTYRFDAFAACQLELTATRAIDIDTSEG